jgi:AcrR family transcriptional regulator
MPRVRLAPDERKQQLLEAAKQVFARRGYLATNVDDICRAAGVSHGTVYRYFDDKEAVLHELLEGVVERVEKVLATRPVIPENLELRGPKPADTIARFCTKRLRELLSAVFVDEATLKLVFREARGLAGAVDRLVDRIDGMVFRAMSEDLRNAQTAGLIRKGDTTLMSRYILGGVEKMVLSALREDEKVDLDAIVRIAVEMELFGILAEEVRK